MNEFFEFDRMKLYTHFHTFTLAICYTTFHQVYSILKNQNIFYNNQEDISPEAF